MSVRSFSVFLDAPEAELVLSSPLAIRKTPTLPSLDTILADAQSNPNVPDSPAHVLSPTLEKENVHPVTGLSAQPTQLSKKRKTSDCSVLATKAVLAPSGPSGSGKAKRPELKQRRSASASSIGKPSKLKRTKSVDGRSALGVASSENGSSPSAAFPRRPSLPLSRSISRILGAVPEDVAMPSVPELDLQAVEQALIDSRCRELTVLPLADVSTAYVQSTTPEAPRAASKGDLEACGSKEGESSFEAQIREYFSPSRPLSAHPSSSSISTGLSAPTPPAITELHNPGFSVFCDESALSPFLDTVDDFHAQMVSEQEKVAELALQYDAAATAPAPFSTPERKELYALFTFTSPTYSP